MENLVFIGFVFIILGIILIITAMTLQHDKRTETKVGVGGFIFFIPFGWANDKEIMKWIIAISIIAIVFLIIMIRGFL